jgi:asparagine synthase (glutamine-hydrolysing)
MCGICGVWGQENRQAVGAMVTAMHHRGPDDCGVFNDARASLGMTRLAIIDPTSGGHQPMTTPSKDIVVIYNGELYNFHSEKALLEKQGYEFASTSDTEVVLRMYEHYGDDFVKRMRGMFALAIYDRRRGPGAERLMLARDQMGIKPLLYAHIDGRLIFASEIKALLASGLVTPEIDPVSLRLLLTYGSVYQPRTIIRGIRMLLPAHRLIVENGRERIERYWSLGLDRDSSLRSCSYEEQVEQVAAVLEESVRLQMISDVPLGAFLSGGVDSALLVALMARQKGIGRLKTFSVGFEDEGEDIDETDDAERTARHIGTEHARIVVRGDDVRERICHIARGLDQPTVDGVNSYFVSLAARQAVTVAISGTGGDELFAGYPWFALMALDELERRGAPAWKTLARAAVAPAVRLRWFNSLPEGRTRNRVEQLRLTTDFRSRYVDTYHIFGSDGAARMLAPQLRRDAGAGQSAYYDLGAHDELPNGSAIERVTGVCLRGYTTNQLLRDIDAASMAHSLEVRVPYLDPIVADTALSLPDRAKLGATPERRADVARSYREAGTKRVLLDVATPLLPPGFDEKPKRGFAMPFSNWLRGPLQDVMTDTLSEISVRRRGLLNANEVAVVRDEFLAGHSDWSRAWLLMMTELWAREVLDHAVIRVTEEQRDGLPGAIAARRGAA